jgi:hypothetical protein
MDYGMRFVWCRVPDDRLLEGDVLRWRIHENSECVCEFSWKADERITMWPLHTVADLGEQITAPPSRTAARK